MQNELDNRIEVRNSSISGRGVFAISKFRKGEIVVKWRPQARLASADLSSCTQEQKHYISPMPDGSYLLMGEPERFVNHSCTPNTTVKGEADVALRDIQPGEEITSNYAEGESLVAFECRCGAEHCVGRVNVTS